MQLFDYYIRHFHPEFQHKLQVVLFSNVAHFIQSMVHSTVTREDQVIANAILLANVVGQPRVPAPQRYTQMQVWFEDHGRIQEQVEAEENRRLQQQLEYEASCVGLMDDVEYDDQVMRCEGSGPYTLNVPSMSRAVIKGAITGPQTRDISNAINDAAIIALLSNDMDAAHTDASPLIIHPQSVALPSQRPLPDSLALSGPSLLPQQHPVQSSSQNARLPSSFVHAGSMTERVFA